MNKQTIKYKKAVFDHQNLKHKENSLYLKIMHGGREKIHSGEFPPLIRPLAQRQMATRAR